MAEDRAIWKGALAGAIAGAAGTFVMNYAHQAWTRIEEYVPLPEEEEDEDSENGDGEEESDEPTTTRAAEKIFEALFDDELDEDQKPVAGQIMHWAMGVGSGAAYGALTSAVPIAGTGFGIPFGAALWVVADEIAVPLSGLSDPPQEVPASTHAEALFAHLIYGVVTDLTRRAIVGLIE